jgi:hypothetical protein
MAEVIILGPDEGDRISIGPSQTTFKVVSGDTTDRFSLVEHALRPISLGHHCMCIATWTMPSTCLRGRSSFRQAIALSALMWEPSSSCRVVSDIALAIRATFPRACSKWMLLAVSSGTIRSLPPPFRLELASIRR